MKLKDIKIVNIGGFRNHFDLPNIWENIENGTLLEFEKNELNAQTTDAVKEITEILKRYEEGRLDEIEMECLDGDCLLKETLKKKLKETAKSSRSHDGSDFCTRNADFLDEMAQEKTAGWNPQAAAVFYLLLLLMIQGNPRGKISKEEKRFIKETVSRFQTHKPIWKEEDTGGTLADGGEAGILYLEEGKVVNHEGKTVLEEKELAGFAYASGIGVIGYRRDGRLAMQTPVQIRWHVEDAEKKLREQGDEVQIAMASAYGQNFALLTKKGNLITNIASEKIRRWKEIHWIYVGLNSIAAIVGKNRMIEQIGSAQELSANFTDVKAVFTRTDRERRYAVLENSSVMTTDDGAVIKSVTAVELNRCGYLYAVQDRIIFRRFDEAQTWSCRPEGLESGSVAQICSAFAERGEKIAVRCRRRGKAEIVWIFRNQFQKDIGEAAQ